jgi:hypothetical protein
MTYDVVLLVEQALTDADARQVLSLHQGIDDEDVVYHVLLPLEDAAARIESAMGSLAAGEVISSPAMVMSDVDLDAVRRDCQDRSGFRCSTCSSTRTSTSRPEVARASPASELQTLLPTRSHDVGDPRR